MFILILVQDTIRVSPNNLDKNLDEAVRDEIHIKFVNKVIPDQGLVVGLYSFEKTSDAYVYASDGGAHVKARFKLVVFRPVTGEVINGKIQSCDSTGIRVTLDFFDAVYIPANELQEPSSFDNAYQVWKWDFEGNALYMDVGEPIRFRVLDVVFGKPAPAAKGSTGEEKALEPLETREMREGRIAADLAAEAITAGKGRLPMTILVNCNAAVGSCKEDGLGMVAWWTAAPADGEAEGEYAGEGEGEAGGGEDAAEAEQQEEVQQEEEAEAAPEQAAGGEEESQEEAAAEGS